MLNKNKLPNAEHSACDLCVIVVKATNAHSSPDPVVVDL